MPLERTAMGNPVYGAAVRRTQVQPDAALSAVSAMANLGSGLLKSKSDAQEAQSVMDAQNDQINNAINPDKMQHQAAYAWTVAENDALELYNQSSAGIQNGDFNSTDPTDFQKSMQDSHQEYYKKWAENDHAEGAVNAYNKFMLKNQSRLTSAQAGKYRLFQKDEQGRALSTRITGMATAGMSTMQDYEAEITSPKYSLMDADTRLQTVLTGVGKHATETGNVYLLEAMDDKYGLSSDPKFHSQFEQLSTAANRKRTAIGSVAIEKQYEAVQGLVDQGILHTNDYAELSKLHDAKGKQVFTPRKFNTLLTKSKVNYSKRQAEAQYSVGLKTGVDLRALKPATFDKAMKGLYEEFTVAGLDPIVANQKLGEVLGQQTNIWTELQDKAAMFGRATMLTGNEPNRETMRRFHELEALEAGMNTHTDGAQLFSKYLRKSTANDSYADYMEIKNALQRTSGSEDEAWMSVAARRDVLKEATKHRETVESLSTEAADFSKTVAENVWDRVTSHFIGWFSLDAPDPTARVQTVIAQEYDRKIAEGRSPEIAKDAAAKFGAQQIQKWGGALHDTHGINLGILLGTTDPDGSWDTLLDDPEYNAKLTEMFGETLGELIGAPGESKYDTQEGRDRYIKSREGTHPILLNNRIHKRVSIDNSAVGDERGSLIFESEDGETTFSIPLKDIGALHNSKLQGTEEIDSLDRLYSAGFLGTNAGRLWHDKQADANSKFSAEVLQTDRATDRTEITPEEYADLPEKEKTRVRKQFYKDHYSGAMGNITRMAEYLGFKRHFREQEKSEVLTFPVPARPEGPGTGMTKAMIKDHEGLRLEQYKDSLGNATIGYGHLSKSGDATKWTQKEADTAFEKDFNTAAQGAATIAGFKGATAARQSALTDLTFNMGVGWDKGFPKFSEAFAKGDYDTAADELVDSDWYKQVGRRGPKIVKLIREG